MHSSGVSDFIRSIGQWLAVVTILGMIAENVPLWLTVCAVVAVAAFVVAAVIDHRNAKRAEAIGEMAEDLKGVGLNQPDADVKDR